MGLMVTLMRVGFIGLILLLFSGTAEADIYTWLDENGVRRYSNTAPPQNAQAERRSELPFDEQAYESRRQMEQKAWQERQIRLEAERSAQLAKQLEETKAKLAEVASKAEEALEAARQAQEVRKERKIRIISPCFNIPPGNKPIAYPKSPGKRPIDKTVKYRPAPSPPTITPSKPFPGNQSNSLNIRFNQ